MKHVILAAALTCSLCIDWTRLSGTVKAINLKDSTVTIQMNDKAILTIPVDYQVKITENHGEMRGISTLHLDDKITLIRIPAPEPPKVENFDEMNKLKG